MSPFAVVLLTGIIHTAAPAGADPALAPWFQGLQVPGLMGAMCCSLSDCRPDATVLHGHDNPTGFAIICFFQGRILCFVPASGA
jgi:hypothetical protein